MQWRFTILSRDGRKTIIEEPSGWAEFKILLKRHPQRHGTFREIQGNSFQFFEKAAWLIKDEYDLYGAKGKMELVVESMSSRGFYEWYRGIFNFSEYHFTCDVDCYVEIDVDKTGPLVDLINRFDQPVDITKTKSFDGVTSLDPYTRLGFDMTLPSKAILLKSEAVTKNEVDSTNYDVLFDADFNNFPNQEVKGFVIPKLNQTDKSEITEFNPSYQFDFERYADNFYGAMDDLDILVNSPESNLQNTNTFNISVRFKGNVQTEYGIFGGSGTSGSIYYKIRLAVFYGRTYTEAFAPLLIDEFASPLVSNATNFIRNSSFDFTWNGALQLRRDEKIWAIFILETTQTSNTGFSPFKRMKFSLTDDSFFKANSSTKANETVSKVFMLNETISRVIESISDNQLKLYSEYFGRTDSQPFSFPQNGCGANRILTNGLQIRNVKLPDGSTPGVFLNMKDLFESLSATDNIGMGPEGENLIRIENWKWFYKTNVIHRCLDIAKIDRIVQASEIYSTFKFGYDKWEAENYNGLDEVLTKREYRLDIPQVKNSLEQICKFIASGYAIEVTRRKGNDSSDWRYDNNIFMICVEPNGPVYRVELGNIANAANIVDPPTIYNFRITPLRNAMRWFDRVISSYRNVNTGHKIIFGSGEGNYVAEGELSSLNCKLEAGVLKENQDLSLTVFADQNAARPIMYPERVKYTYPLECNEYKKIADNPYGLIEFTSSCDRGFGWIDQLDYRPNEGLADYTLIPQIR